jgi:hypothetical protein
VRAEILAGDMALALALALAAAGGGAACSDSRGSTTAPTGAETADPRAEALRQDIRAIVDAIARGDERTARSRAGELAMPRAGAWFAETFGAAGERIAAEYDPLAGQLPQLVDALRPWVSAGPVDIAVERFADPADPGATGYQAAALAAMERRVPLYSVRLTASAGDAGASGVYHLWSFVDVDGRFRWVGKMRPLVGAPPGTGIDPLELRLRDRPALP